MNNRIYNSLVYLKNKKRDDLNIENFSAFLKIKEEEILEAFAELQKQKLVRIFPQEKAGLKKTLIYKFVL